MTTGTLERKHAILLLAGVTAILLLKFAVLDGRTAPVVAATESAPMAENRLRKVRATRAGKRESGLSRPRRRALYGGQSSLSWRRMYSRRRSCR